MAAEREAGPPARARSGVPQGFHHEALVYEGRDGFIAGTLPFVRGAVAAGEPVMVAVDPQKAEWLRGELGGTPHGVTFADMRELGANPGAIISAWHDFASEHARSGTPLRGIGEPVWPGRSDAELHECFRHECLLNAAFADGPPFQLVCPYDAATLDRATLERARESHPYVHGDGVSRPSDRYAGLSQLRSLLAEPLPDPPAGAQQRAFDHGTLHDLRVLVTRYAVESGLDPLHTENAMLAVNELASNSVRHGGGSGVLRWWREGATPVWEVSDAGWITDVLAGRRRPADGTNGGFGLWMVNQLADLVQLRSSPAGTVVRMHVRPRA